MFFLLFLNFFCATAKKQEIAAVALIATPKKKRPETTKRTSICAKSLNLATLNATENFGGKIRKIPAREERAASD